MGWASTDMCGILHLCLCLCLLCQYYHIICAFLLVHACPADETDLVCASACAALAQLLQDMDRGELLRRALAAKKMQKTQATADLVAACEALART